MTSTKKILCAFLLLTIPAGAIRAQSPEEATIDAASEVLREIMLIRAKAIPESLLADAHGVVIIPGMVKGGFVVGVRHGKGVVLSRNGEGQWTAPVFITVTGGSVGFQAGLQSTDVIAVFRNRQGVDKLMRGKFTIGADAAVAAGPVGREASAATDSQLKAEILSYSRSRGLFAGVAIDGAVMQIDQKATAAYYAPKPGQVKESVPAPAVKLVEQIVAYVDAKNKPPINVQELPGVPPANQAVDVEAIRRQLAERSLGLHKILDAQWKAYLALPGEVYAEGKSPNRDAFTKCLDRYGAVASDARYKDLSAHAEFRATHDLLIRYGKILEGTKSGPLKLPSPPN